MSTTSNEAYAELKLAEELRVEAMETAQAAPQGSAEAEAAWAEFDAGTALVEELRATWARLYDAGQNGGR